jgi:hypothetical protein
MKKTSKTIQNGPSSWTREFHGCRLKNQAKFKDEAAYEYLNI